jgi:hypothetical protein
MAKGNPPIPIRFPKPMREQMQAVIGRSLHTRRAGPWEFASFVRKAVAEKLAHAERSNTKRRRRREELAARGGMTTTYAR